MEQVLPLSPLREILTIEGTVSWNDDRRKIIINKTLRLIYSDLNKKSSRIGYAMEFCMSKEQLIKRFHEHLEKNRIPILLFFYKDKEQPIVS